MADTARAELLQASRTHFEQAKDAMNCRASTPRILTVSIASDSFLCETSWQDVEAMSVKAARRHSEFLQEVQDVESLRVLEQDVMLVICTLLHR